MSWGLWFLVLFTIYFLLVFPLIVTFFDFDYNQNIGESSIQRNSRQNESSRPYSSLILNI